MSITDSMSRREWLAKGSLALAALGLGARSLAAAADVLKPRFDDLSLGEACTLTCAQTLGPCYYSGRAVRHDITEGNSGLPALLGFLVVNADTCQPVANATVDIWHTDANGWAHFRTIYPGWYSGRTTHIHATIRVGGTSMVTTQFYFDDALTDRVYGSHPAYSSRPARNTRNNNDGVIGGSTTRVSPFLLNAKLLGDNSLVALKVIAVRNSPTTCNA